MNKLDDEGYSALHYAARDEKPDIVTELLAAGAGKYALNTAMNRLISLQLSVSVCLKDN